MIQKIKMIEIFFLYKLRFIQFYDFKKKNISKEKNDKKIYLIFFNFIRF